VTRSQSITLASLFVSFAYGNNYHTKNLEWSKIFLEQSRDYELKNKVLENTMNVLILKNEEFVL